MSFFDDLVDFGSTAWDWFSGDSTSANIARTALAGYAVNQLQSATTPEQVASAVTQTNTVDPGVRLTINPSTEARIPVVYGECAIEGIITDAYLTQDNKLMYYCLTLCEQTGKENLGQGPYSTFKFKDIYWDDQRVVFKNNSPLVEKLVDNTGKEDLSVNQKIAIYCYDGWSNNQVPVETFSISPVHAYDVFPNWTSQHLMSGLIFAIVIIEYNKTANLTKLGTVKFHLQNSMHQPGDCLYDYMTNGVYGAGIAEEGIYTQ